MNEAAGDERDFAEEGRKLFAGYCDFMWAASKADGLPPIGPPEIAFAGRSNVGKSSLLNALTNRKALARTSHTPGRTQELNFFALGDEPPNERMRMIDMPGYGYAAVAKTRIESWTRLMRAYLRGRSSLKRVYVLVDGRHGFKELDSCAVSYQIVLTKLDEVKKSDRETRVAATLAGLKRHPAAYPEVIFTSSQTGEGIPELRTGVARLLAEMGL